MPLNKMQLERIESRINSAKRAYIETKHSTKTPNVPEYTDKEMTEMIRNGAAQLKHDCTVNSYAPLKKAFIFPPTEAMAAAQSAHDEWLAARRLIVTAADAIAEQLMDVAVLEKDGMVALDRIAEAFKT